MLYNVRNRGANPLFVTLYILQEFQYGNNVFQTTTNKVELQYSTMGLMFF